MSSSPAGDTPGSAQQSDHQPDQQSDSQAAQRGGLIVPVPAAEARVVPWMERYLPIWKLGVPAHVTLLFPFLTLAELDAAALADLGSLFAGTPAIEVTFATIGQFPDVVYLAPEPRDWFIRQTERLSARFGLLPYGGQHDVVIPHLTVARHTEPAVLQTIAAELERLLPIVTTVHEVLLMEEQADGCWRRAASFPLGPIESCRK